MTNPIPPDIKVPLKDGDYAPDQDTLRKTFWLHRRHTSVTYISRMTEMLEAFTQGFNAYLANDPNPGIFAFFLRSCYRCLDGQKKGLERLRKADHSGFKLIRDAMNFRNPFYDRPDEYGFEPLGYRGYDESGVALWSWIEKVIPMSLEIEGVLSGEFCYPLFNVSQFHFPETIDNYPLGENKFIRDGRYVPITGVWHPISLKGGCPNFLIRGEQAPKAKLPVLRIDSPAWDDRIAGIHYKAQSDFDIGDFPTQWQLIWEDDRWRNGRAPLGEEEYIDGPDTALPTDPPVALQDPPRQP